MRKVLVPVLLIASHGIALWLGGFFPQGEGIWSGFAAMGGAEKLPPALSPDDLRRRLAIKEAANEEEPSWEEAVQAAREKIPADADVEAMVKAATKGVDPWDLDSDKVEIPAAYAIWLDRDPIAALRWLGTWDPDACAYDLFDMLILHLEADNFSKVGSYLAAAPEASEHLLDMDVYDRIEEKYDPATRVSIALSLPAQEDRLEWLQEMLNERDEFRGQLATIRRGLGASESVAFLEHVFDEMPDAELLEEIRTAGFPAAALARFLADYEESTRDSEDGPGPSAAEAERSSLSAGWEKELDTLVPDYGVWCHEAADGRMSMDEVVSRLKAALPESPGGEQELRLVVFKQLFTLDPRGAMAWLGKSGPEVQRAIHDAALDSDKVPVELRVEIAASMLDGELDPRALSMLQSDYQGWYRDDPKGCRRAVEALPPGPLKDSLLAMTKEGAGG